jgi:ribosomal protein S18 acetylase RimI-like enzyme
MGEEQITTTYLEMKNPTDLQPKRVSLARLEIRQVEIASPEFNWFLHQAVGTAFRWGGREDWGRGEWVSYTSRQELETWVAYVKGAPAGYCEMEKQTDGGVEIKMFGLLAQFFGQGLGGHLLTEMVERAWKIGANRVWLHTCTHDHEHALGNYLARGFKVTDEKIGPANRAHKGVLFTPPKFV